MLQMFYLFENIRSFRKNLLTFYKKADTTMQRYDLYHSLKLFEFGLLSYYTQNEALTGEKLCPRLTDLVGSIYLTSQKNDTESYLNINIILQSEKEFNLLIKLMSDVVGKQNELFGTIRREKKMEMVELHEINRELLGIDRRILGIYMSLEDYLKKLPTFFYPPLVVYYSWVRNEYTLRQKLYFEYKNRLQVYEYNLSTLGNISQSNMAQDSIVFNVSLQQENFGEIINISPDYFCYLKMMDNNESPIGKNINIIFPDSIASAHANAMKKMSGFHKLLNFSRSFFVKRFDGRLQRVKFIVKIFPILSKSISAVTLVRVLQQEAGTASLILIDKDLKIDCFEDSLDDLFQYSPLDGLTHVKQISQKLYMEVLQYLGYYRDQWLESNKNLLSAKQISKVLDRATAKIKPDEFLKAPKLDFIDILNLGHQGRGKIYRIAPESYFFREYGNNSISCSIETEMFANSQIMFKLYVNMYESADSDSECMSSELQKRYEKKALSGLKGIKNLRAAANKRKQPKGILGHFTKVLAMALQGDNTTNSNESVSVKNDTGQGEASGDKSGLGRKLSRRQSLVRLLTMQNEDTESLAKKKFKESDCDDLDSSLEGNKSRKCSSGSEEDESGQNNHYASRVSKRNSMAHKSIKRAIGNIEELIERDTGADGPTCDRKSIDFNQLFSRVQHKQATV